MHIGFLSEKYPPEIGGLAISSARLCRGLAQCGRAVEVFSPTTALAPAARQTTSNALTWTWYLLSQFPAIAQQLQAELDAVLGDRLPALADLPQLPYTLQVLKEAMRLYPPVWILNTREPLTETTIGDYTIPKGTQIFISQYIMHRRPQYFPAPERFDPTRWTPEFEAGLPRYAYMPFGGGPRICIGNSFAMMEAQLLLATLARRFAFTLMPDQVVEPNPLVTLGAKYGMRMRVAVRRKEREPPVAQSQTDGAGVVSRQDEIRQIPYLPPVV